MFALRKPDARSLALVRERCGGLPLSHACVGPTGACPPGYVIDHHRVRLGFGSEVFSRACQAVRSWQMLRLGWLEPAWSAEVEPGALMGTLTRVFGVWTLNVCRVVQVSEETGAVSWFGLTWATLPGHVERGEERFLVEWQASDNAVWYDIWAMSAPGQFLTRLAYPLTRRWQKAFARDSMQAMLRAVEGCDHPEMMAQH